MDVYIRHGNGIQFCGTSKWTRNGDKCLDMILKDFFVKCHLYFPTYLGFDLEIKDFYIGNWVGYPWTFPMCHRTTLFLRL